MKHVAQIQFEFCKLAVRSWDDMTIDEQWAYLRDHPGSKKRLTAKPRSYQEQAVRSWDDMTIDEQWAYLRDHPGSKKRLTAKPRSYQEQADDIKQLDKDAEILSKN